MPKDVQAFIRIAEKSGCDFTLLKEVEKINQHRVEHFVEKVRRELWVLRGKKIAAWGLAFKLNTDDVRFAPALSIIRRLIAEGAIVQDYDPQAMEKASNELPSVNYWRDIYRAAQGVEAILVLTEWDKFCEVDWARLLPLVERPLILDGRNIMVPEEITAKGVQYVGIGGVSAAPIAVGSRLAESYPLSFSN